MELWQDEWGQQHPADRQNQRRFRTLNTFRSSSLRRFREPLLVEQTHADRHFPAPHSRHVSPRGDFELVETDTSHYRPPPMTQTMIRDEGEQDALLSTRNRDQQRHNPSFPSMEFPNHATVDFYGTTYHALDGDMLADRNRESAVSKSAISLVSHGLMCCQCVRTQELGFVENCGRFDSIVGPGLHLNIWPFSGVSDRLTLRMKMLKVQLQCNTVDQVYCHLELTIQYRASPTRAYEAYYRLHNIETFLQSLVLDALRSRIPLITLEQLYCLPEESITYPIKDALFGKILEYGYELCELLITNMQPHQVVRQAMNEIGGCKREKVAAAFQGEANRIKVVAQAQAHAERLYLLGVGVARQRRVMIQQFWVDSVHHWMNDVYIQPKHLPTNQELLTLLLMTQYYDVLTAVAAPKQNKQNDGNENVSCRLLIHHTDLAQAIEPPLQNCVSRKSQELLQVQ